MKRLLMLSVAVMMALSIVAAPKAAPVDTVDVVCYDLVLNTDFIGLFGMTYIFANNRDYELTGAIYADSIPPGTYDNCVMDLTHNATQKKIPSRSVVLTLGRDANNYATIQGEMLGEDDVLYRIDLSWQTPLVKDTTTIVFQQTSAVAYYPDLGHDFMLSNQNEDFSISLDIVQVPMGETFTERNLNTPYCLIANKLTQDTVEIAAAEGKVWQSNDTTYLSAMVTGFDSVLYDIQMWYAVPKVSQTKELTITGATFYNELASDGYYALVGMTDDRQYEFAISLLGDTEEDVPGEYVNDGVFGGFSGVGYDFLHFIGGQYTTYVAKWNQDRKDFDIISIEKGRAVVAMDENQNVYLDGVFVGADGVEYKVILSSKVDKPRIIDDAVDGAVDRCFVNEKEVTIEQQTEDKVLFEVMTSSDLLALWFYVEYVDGEMVIPEGEYSIDDSGDYWSVVAGDGSLGQSFYATHDGVNFTSLYFLVGGTVLVTKKDGKLCLEMDALNSYDVPVHVVYDPTATGLPVVDAHKGNIKKLVRDGRVLIQQNGQEFGLQGERY